MPFPKEYLNEIRTRISVSSVVSKKVKLNKRGREYLGLSPFNVEKTPSFTVNDNEGFYHCFSSGEHGDIFTFLMKTEGLSFPEAVERLANEAGLEVYRSSNKDIELVQRNKLLYQAVEAATVFFQNKLFSPSGKHVLDYLLKRGLTEKVIKKYRLGFAPAGNTLKVELIKSYKEEVLIDSKLLARPKDGGNTFDFFRNRIMFPIFDFRGAPVAFGGRIINKGQPKYLNSPETPLFTKGNLLYGYHLARESAFSNKALVVTEGYMDVLSLASKGMNNVVASLGTALTEDQVRTLWKVVPEPILCFDGDKAGRKAALRIAERIMPFLIPGFSLNFALLPLGKDPDDIVKEGGIDAINNLINDQITLYEIIWRNKVEGRLLDTPERRAAIKAEIKELVNSIKDKDVHSEYNWFINEQFYNFFRNKTKNNSISKIKTHSVLSVELVRDIRHRILLSTIINHLDLLDYVEERIGSMYFENSVLDEIRQQVLKTLSKDGNLDKTDIRNHFVSLGLEGEFDKIVCTDLYIHAAFARPESTLNEAKQGWDDTFSLCQNENIRADIKDASGEFVEEPSLAGFERLKQLFDEGRNSFDNDNI